MAAKIVIAEDADEIRDLVAEVLEDAGYAVLAVGDGLDGLEVIRSDHPDLVVLDVAMPGMTGDAVLRQMRADRLTIPVVLMTAAPDIQRLLEAGATAILPKPFEIDQLLRTVATALQPAVA